MKRIISSSVCIRKQDYILTVQLMLPLVICPFNYLNYRITQECASNKSPYKTNKNKLRVCYNYIITILASGCNLL